jgi:hypothetical protein
MDSDKTRSRSRINDTKLRIQHEFTQGQSKSWITKGREIENYVKHDLMQEAVKQVYSARYHSAPTGNLYDHAFSFWPIASNGKRSSKLETSVDKVRIAKLVAQHPTDLDVLDLKKNIKDLVDRVDRANG